jgi:flagellin-like hook-associated protein FlgL
MRLATEFGVLSTALAGLQSQRIATEITGRHLKYTMDDTRQRPTLRVVTASGVQDVDTAKAATDSAIQHASYQAALASMSNIVQLSLTQFLE